MFMFRGVRHVMRKSNLCSCNPLVTLGVSDRSRCGLAHLEIARANPCQFGRVRSHSLWCGAYFESWHNPLGTLGVSGKKVFYRELVQRSCHRDLLERSCKETTCRDLAMTEKEVSKEILPTGLLQISCQESSYEGLVQRSCQETSCKDVVQRPDLVKRAEILLRDL